jgi:hypothetical protein
MPRDTAGRHASCIIEVVAESATYLKLNTPRAVTLFKVAKAVLTGTPPKVGDLGHLDRAELAGGAGRK